MQKPLNPYAQTIKKKQDDIVLAYMPALRAMAFRLKERLPAHINVSDLIDYEIGRASCRERV